MMAEHHDAHEEPRGHGRLGGAEESAVIGGEQEDQEQPAL